jgi:hypothetical protein
MRTLGAIGGTFCGVVLATACARGTGATSDVPSDASADTSEDMNLLGNGDASGHPCVNLQCQQVECPDERDTTVSGIVFDPAGRHPLYNAIVYVPNAPLQPFATGTTCDRCGVLASGDPVVTALTGPDGRFVLHHVPTGDAIPLVLQLGKWRKQLVIPHVTACQDTAMDDPSTMRLPAKQSEGDMPHIAVATGGCDPFECLLRKIGIDDSEFTEQGSGGRVDMYQGVGGAAMSPSTSTSATLWASPSISYYDVVVNACECGEVPAEKPQTSIDNLVAYANSGGRLFNTHYQYYWIDPSAITSQTATSANPAWQSTAQFIPEQQGTTAIGGYIDTTFPKGAAFAQWLIDVGGTSALGVFPLEDVRYNVQAVNSPSTRWIYNPNLAETQIGGQALLHYTFNTPVGESADQQCGEVLFADFHVVASANVSGTMFPQECDTQPMSPQELALEFMFFDLSACIQSNTEAPQPPQTVQ